MKIQHKVPISLRLAPEANSERYQAEIDRAVHRAEKAWRQAERRRAHAEKRTQRAPTAENRQAYDLVRAEAERLWAEFEEVDRLMRQAPVSGVHAGAGQVRHRTGCDDNLQLGIYKRPKRRSTPEPGPSARRPDLP